MPTMEILSGCLIWRALWPSTHLNPRRIRPISKLLGNTITTYILSRKVRIKGLLGLKTKEEMEEEERMLREEEVEQDV